MFFISDSKASYSNYSIEITMITNLKPAKQRIQVQCHSVLCCTSFILIEFFLFFQNQGLIIFAPFLTRYFLIVFLKTNLCVIQQCFLHLKTIQNGIYCLQPKRSGINHYLCKNSTLVLIFNIKYLKQMIFKAWW